MNPLKQHYMYKPLPDNVTINRSPIHGLGLWATKDIPNGHIFGVTHVKDIEFEDNYIRTPLGGFFNHSTTPNCEIVEDGRFLKLRAISDIKSGEEITAFYTLYDPTK